MDAFTYHTAVIVALIIITLFIIYWMLPRVGRACQRRHQRRYRRQYMNSAGGADDAARATLTALRNTTDPFERFARGYINRFNMADDRPRSTEDVIADYAAATHAIAQGHMPNDGLIVLDDNTDANAGNHADFIIQEIEGLLDDDAAINAALWADVQTAREQIRADRHRRMHRHGPTVSGTAGTAIAYLHDAGRVLSDTQNVHDSAVVRNLRGVVNRLTQLQPMNKVQIDRALNDIRGYCTQKADTQALSALDSIIKDGERPPLDAYGTPTKDLLAMMWMRHTDDENSGVEVAIKDAVVAALHDCVEHGNMVCMGGKAARVIGALVTIDADPIIAGGGGPMTVTMIKHEVFSECSKLIEASAHELDSAEGDVADTARTQLQNQFEAIIAPYKDDGQITAADASRLLAECIAAI